MKPLPRSLPKTSNSPTRPAGSKPFPGSVRSWPLPCWPKCPNWERSPARTAAALAGVAPYNRDSGGQKGSRSIQGGRGAARNALYMATLTAMRYDRILKEFYLRLRAAGKKPLVAMTACMRKLVILMNRLLKNNDFQLAN